MTEQHLTRAIIDAINATGYARVWRNQSGRVRVRGGFMQLAPEGTPDVVGFMLRTCAFVGIEVKLPGEQPTDAQESWLELMRKAGCVSGVAWSVNDAVRIVAGARLARVVSDG